MAGNGDDQRAPRDVKNHLLFEIATEVAHRGMRSTLKVSLGMAKLTYLV